MKNFNCSIILLFSLIGITLFSQSSNLTLSGEWRHSTQMGVVYGSGNIVYTSTHKTIFIIDVAAPSSNASSVRALGQIQEADNINWITENNSKAYIAAGDSGLRIVNVSNPYQPTNMGFCYTNGYAWCVSVSGNYAYVAADTAGLRIIDISNPNAPVPVSYFDMGTTIAKAVTVSGNYAYVAYGNSGLRIVDISNPLVPVAAGFLNWTNFNPFNIFVAGNYAYLLKYDSLHIVNIANPLSPVQTSGIYTSASNAGSLFVSGNFAYTCSGLFGYNIWNISNPNAPTSAGTYNAINFSNSTNQGIYINNNTAYYTYNDYIDNVSQVDIVDVANPSATVSIGKFRVPQMNLDICTSGNHIYALGWTPPQVGMISIYDDGITSFPTQIGMYYDSSNISPGMTSELVNSGNYLFLSGTKTGTGNSYGFKIIDVSNPYNPTYTGKFNIPNGVSKGISVSGNYAYVCFFSLGLKVVDISNPALPVQVGSVNLSGGFQALEVFTLGNYAYVTDNSGRFHVVDVSNPTLPVDVGSVQMSTNGTDIYVSGNYAYVARGAQGLQIIDVSNPVSPSLLGTYTAVSGSTKLHKLGNTIYISDFSNGLQAIDVSNPLVPFQSGYYFGISSGNRNVFVDSLHIYLVSSYGLYIFNDAFITSTIISPSEENDLSVFPNPSDGIFTFEIPHQNSSIASVGKVEVFNTTGELVFQSQMKESRLTINLDFLPAGIYFAKIISNNEIAVRSEKIIIQ